jgi:hypothetical protein
VPIAVIPLVIFPCYRLWRSSIELTGDGTLIVRTLFRTRRIPVAQIFGLRWGEHGLRITLIDGRIVTSSVLLTGIRRRRPPDEAASAISAITQAIEAARSARPAETEAAIAAGAPLRARRRVRHMVVWTVVGPAMLIVLPAGFAEIPGLASPVCGIAYTLVSFRAAYSLLRVARPGAAKAYPRRRRR